jgi:hypothetical protein
MAYVSVADVACVFRWLSLMSVPVVVIQDLLLGCRAGDIFSPKLCAYDGIPISYNVFRFEVRCFAHMRRGLNVRRR